MLVQISPVNVTHSISVCDSFSMVRCAWSLPDPNPPGIRFWHGCSKQQFGILYPYLLASRHHKHTFSITNPKLTFKASMVHKFLMWHVWHMDKTNVHCCTATGTWNLPILIVWCKYLIALKTSEEHLYVISYRPHNALLETQRVCKLWQSRQTFMFFCSLARWTRKPSNLKLVRILQLQLPHPKVQLWRGHQLGKPQRQKTWWNHLPDQPSLKETLKTSLKHVWTIRRNITENPASPSSVKFCAKFGLSMIFPSTFASKVAPPNSEFHLPKSRPAGRATSPSCAIRFRRNYSCANMS